VRLASRGRRETEGGTERIDDEELLRALRRRALGIIIGAPVLGAAVAALMYIL
jgi:hypothetical protein